MPGCIFYGHGMPAAEQLLEHNISIVFQLISPIEPEEHTPSTAQIAIERVLLEHLLKECWDLCTRHAHTAVDHLVQGRTVFVCPAHFRSTWAEGIPHLTEHFATLLATLLGLSAALAPWASEAASQWPQDWGRVKDSIVQIGLGDSVN